MSVRQAATVAALPLDRQCLSAILPATAFTAVCLYFISIKNSLLPEFIGLASILLFL